MARSFRWSDAAEVFAHLMTEALTLPADMIPPEAEDFVFVAVESEWPYAACAVMLDDEGKAQGRRDYRRNLNTYAECRKSGIWPGYSKSIEIVNLPTWALTE